MRIDRIALHSAAVAVAVLSATVAHAETSALGLWVDHTGRGAVEITDCNGKLCGHVAWVQDSKNSDQCGKQIIGNVKPVGKNKWDNGWIYDPDRGSKYDVELTALAGDKLRVTGYAGTKWLSESYTWKRAPADMQKCNATGDSAAKATPPPADKPADTAKAEPAKPDVTKPSTEAKSGAVKLDAAKPDTGKADNAKPDTTKSIAKTDEAKPEGDTAETAKANDEDDTSDEPKGGKRGKVLARIMDELEDGDGPVKLKRSGNTCKVNVPYVGLVKFRCDGKD
jgi:uncharacterized protein (DUF2147 family)